MIEDDFLKQLWGLDEEALGELDSALSADKKNEENSELLRQEYAQQGRVQKTERILSRLVSDGTHSVVQESITSIEELIMILEVERDSCLRIALRYAKGDTYLAEDIYQKATIRAFNYLRNKRTFVVERRAVRQIQLDDEQEVNLNASTILIKNPVAWLRCIIRNTAYNEIRQQKRKHTFLRELQRDVERESPRFESPETTVLRNMSYADLHYYVSCLPKQCSKIIKDHYFKGMKYEEIAKEIGYPATTVRTQAKRALTILRDILTNKRVIKDGKIGARSRRKITSNEAA